LLRAEETKIERERGRKYNKRVDESGSFVGDMTITLIESGERNILLLENSQASSAPLSDKCRVQMEASS
jgi:hypothetical protein